MTIDMPLIQSSNIVIFAPHPDDDVLGCAGIISKRLKAERKTQIVYLTDGRNAYLLPFGIKEKPTPSQIKEMRKREVLEAQRMLGNQPQALHFFNFEDGLLHFNKKAAVKKTLHFLCTFQPQLILVPYKYDVHPDHIATYDIVDTAVKTYQLDTPVYQYFTWGLSDVLKEEISQAHLLIDIKDEIDSKKVAISRFKTQITFFSKQQLSPVLSSEFLDYFCSDNELFLSNNELHMSFTSSIYYRARSTLRAYRNLFHLLRKHL